ncbi:MAG: hypothetical protein V1729_04505 [Candidatus Woesearchaeota archaeon]
MTIDDNTQEEYDERFDKYEKEELRYDNVPPHVANKYPTRFGTEEIIQLIKIGCSGETARQYDEHFSGYEITLLYGIGLHKERLGEKFERVMDNMRLVANTMHFAETEGMEIHSDNAYENFSYVGCGSDAIIILDRRFKKALKFCSDPEKEHSLISRLRKTQKNVIHAENLEDQAFAPIEVEYIDGESLEMMIDRENKLHPDRVKQYAADILNGLIELRSAGIYQHRDIRPANIMIDETNDRAIIIDLGIATTDPYAPPKDNRRYGGPNDLTSLGQVMYKMATGDHLFAKSKSMERASQADRLKDHRDWVYEKDSRLRFYLTKVYKNIEDGNLCDAITFCLKASGTDEEYTKLQDILERTDISPQ